MLNVRNLFKPDNQSLSVIMFKNLTAEDGYPCETDGVTKIC